MQLCLYRWGRLTRTRLTARPSPAVSCLRAGAFECRIYISRSRRPDFVEPVIFLNVGTRPGQAAGQVTVCFAVCGRPYSSRGSDRVAPLLFASGTTSIGVTLPTVERAYGRRIANVLLGPVTGSSSWKLVRRRSRIDVACRPEPATWAMMRARVRGPRLSRRSAAARRVVGCSRSDRWPIVRVRRPPAKAAFFSPALQAQLIPS